MTAPDAATIRPLALADIARVLAWRNDTEVARYMSSDHVVTEVEHARWFAAALNDESKRYWIIEADGRPVGLIGLYAISPEQRRAEWGFYIADPAVRGRGIGAAAWRRVLAVAFDELGLAKVASEVLATNRHSIAMHEHFGFRIDGVLRAHVIKEGRRVDVVTMSLLRDEWLSNGGGSR